MLDRTIAPSAGAIVNPKLQEAKEHKLDNGVSLFTITSNNQPVVKIEFSLKSGIWYEHIPGLSWLTAKMIQEGSQNKASNEIAELFEFYGAFVEISPGFDSNNLSFYCPKAHFENVAELIAEILFKPSFPEEEIEILKNKKKRELEVNLEKTNFLASRKIRESLFGIQHPYGRSLQTGEIDGLEHSKCIEYYASQFFNGLEIFLSGDVNDNDINILNALFGKKSLSDKHSNAPNWKKSTTKELYEYKEDSLQSSIRFGLPIPANNHPDHFKLVIVNEILGGYFGSRLMKNLREEKGLTYGIHSYPIFLQHESFLIISTDVKSEQTGTALDEIHKEIKILQTEKVQPDELDLIRNYMAGSFLSSISTTFQLMEKFKSIHQHDLNYDYFSSFMSELKSVTSDDILETASQYLQREDFSVVIVGKK